MKEKIYRDLWESAKISWSYEFEDFIHDLCACEGPEFSTSNELTAETLESYMSEMLSAALNLWGCQSGEWRGNYPWLIEYTGLSKVFILHTLSLAFKYSAEFKRSDSSIGATGGRLPECVGYLPQTDLKSWSFSIPNFLISVMHKEIGWDVEKYPTFAAREKAYRNECQSQEITKLGRNAVTNALRQVDRAYDFVYSETDRFRKYLNKIFVDYDFYQAKCASEISLRFKSRDDPARIAYLTNSEREKLSSAQDARKEPRVIPYSEWLLYAVQYLDSSPKLADLASLDSNDSDFDFHRLRAKRLYRLIQESDPSYTDNDIKYWMKDLHAQRYPRKNDENEEEEEEEITIREAREKKKKKQKIIFNEKMMNAYCVYPGYGTYRFMGIAENRIPVSSHWRCPAKVIPTAERTENGGVDVKGSFLYALFCWIRIKDCKTEDLQAKARLALVECMRSILFRFGYGELFNRISNLPQRDELLSYNIYTRVFIQLLKSKEFCEREDSGNFNMKMEEIFDLRNENIKDKLEFLNRWFTDWCGRFYNRYAFYIVKKLIDKEVSPELLDDTMALVLKKLFEGYNQDSID